MIGTLRSKGRIDLVASEVGNMMSGPGSSPENRMMMTPAGELRGRILIADDLFAMRTLLRAVLSEAGHTVVAEAATGREAVSLYYLFRPDVVLMDITMPDQDGLSAMEEILRIAPQAQVVVCTAMGFKKTACEALARGACDFIAKPFRPANILSTVQCALRRIQSREARGADRDHKPRFGREGAGGAKRPRHSWDAVRSRLNP